VHISNLLPLRRPSFSIDEGDAEAKSPGRNHTAADSAMMLLVAHQRAQQLRTPPSRNASLTNDWHVENRKIPLGEPLEPRIVVGDNVAIGPYCELHGPGKITVGCNSNIGAYVTITTGLNSQVSIGDNVDIGEGCTIGAGVQIGHRTTVPSGTVIVYDVSTG
jgi:acetyltransferase-like isoleucine patch superfamily enzyme